MLASISIQSFSAVDNVFSPTFPPTNKTKTSVALSNKLYKEMVEYRANLPILMRLDAEAQKYLPQDMFRASSTQPGLL